MGYSTYARSRWLNTWRNVDGRIVTTYASLHTGDPGDTGASEVSGGSPAYARQAITWNAAAAGSMDGDPVSFDVPASTTILYVGLWDASTVGNYLGSRAVAPVTIVSQGTYLLADLDASLT